MHYTSQTHCRDWHPKLKLDDASNWCLGVGAFEPNVSTGRQALLLHSLLCEKGSAGFFIVCVCEQCDASPPGTCS